MSTKESRELVWIRTDEDGQIESLSRRARELLGLADGPGHNLFLFFPTTYRAMALDAEQARAGWTHARNALLEPLAGRPVAVRYVVSATVTDDRLQFYWFFELPHAQSPAA